MSTSTREVFWEYLCGFLPLWRTLAMVDVVILVLLVFAFPFLSPGTGAFVVAVLASVIVLVSLGFYGIVYYKCADR